LIACSLQNGVRHRPEAEHPHLEVGGLQSVSLRARADLVGPWPVNGM
jgi:hypothetical protein